MLTHKRCSSNARRVVRGRASAQQPPHRTIFCFAAQVAPHHGPGQPKPPARTGSRRASPLALGHVLAQHRPQASVWGTLGPVFHPLAGFWARHGQRSRQFYRSLLVSNHPMNIGLVSNCLKDASMVKYLLSRCVNPSPSILSFILTSCKLGGNTLHYVTSPHVSA